jgi:hypothetical protein
MLCQYCENLEIADYVRKDIVYNHQPSWVDLVQSAANGCQLCEMLRRELIWQTPSSSLENVPSGIVSISSLFVRRHYDLGDWDPKSSNASGEVENVHATLAGRAGEATSWHAVLKTFQRRGIQVSS